MNLLLTDRLICPRCVDGMGLILLASSVAERRVREGQLGCPGCHAKYPVVNGVADFGAGPAAAPAEERADALRLAALLGVTEGPAMVLLWGGFDRVAGEIATLLPDVEVVVASAGFDEPQDRPGVSLLRIDERMPLHDRSMRGAVVARSEAGAVAEAARVCGLAARLVLMGATKQVRESLATWGLHMVAEQDDTLVAVRHA